MVKLKRFYYLESSLVDSTDDEANCKHFWQNNFHKNCYEMTIQKIIPDLWYMKLILYIHMISLNTFQRMLMSIV